MRKMYQGIVKASVILWMHYKQYNMRNIGWKIFKYGKGMGAVVSELIGKNKKYTTMNFSLKDCDHKEHSHTQKMVT